jgi:hypothetical protein
MPEVAIFANSNLGFQWRLLLKFDVDVRCRIGVANLFFNASYSREQEALSRIESFNKIMWNSVPKKRFVRGYWYQKIDETGINDTRT